ncbi:MAG TPA: lasso peptide [Candidatus Acidoferrales bacterium]|nr:lasso peptide [Candidatus Acidoferrales bacterium]
MSKKLYKSPVLIIHGTVKELTQLLGRRGNADNLIDPLQKTHL